jgi:hypothetical protein
MHTKRKRMPRGLDAVFNVNHCGLLAAMHTGRVLEKTQKKALERALEKALVNLF